MSISLTHSLSYPLLLKNHNAKRLGGTSTVALANNKKTDWSGKDSQKAPPKLRISNTLVAPTVVVFSLGFIDAGYGIVEIGRGLGYSGDWSRIGVISTETEDFLKAAAFVVVPALCLFLAYNISNDEQEEA